MYSMKDALNDDVKKVRKHGEDTCVAIDYLGFPKSREILTGYGLHNRYLCALNCIIKLEDELAAYKEN